MGDGLLLGERRGRSAPGELAKELPEPLKFTIRASEFLFLASVG